MFYIVSEPERCECKNDIMSSLCHFRNGPKNGSKKWVYGPQNWGMKTDAETPPTCLHKVPQIPLDCPYSLAICKPHLIIKFTTSCNATTPKVVYKYSWDIENRKSIIDCRAFSVGFVTCQDRFRMFSSQKCSSFIFITKLNMRCRNLI